MVEFFAELARRTLVISGLAVLLEVVLPKGHMKRCTQLVMGVLLLATFIEPVVEILPQKQEVLVAATIFTDIAGDRQDNTEEIIAAGSQFRTMNESEVKEDMAEELSQQIRDLVRENVNVEDCRVEVSFAEDVSEGMAEGAALASTGYAWGQVAIMLAVESEVDEVAAKLAEEVKDKVAVAYDLPGEAVSVSWVVYGS